MSRVRSVFLAPAAVVSAALIVIPLFIICTYSFLSRGAYGGVTFPWTAENYGRVLDANLRRYCVEIFCDCGGSHRNLSCRGISSRALHRALGIETESAFKPGDASVLDQFPDSARMPGCSCCAIPGLSTSTLLSLHLIREPLSLLYNEGAVLLGLV